MKNILIISIFFLLTFQQALSQDSIVVTKHVYFKIIKNKVSVNVAAYKGTISVKYWLKRDKELVYKDYEFTNMKGFHSTSQVRKGDYIVEVNEDYRKSRKEFKVN
jgi:hypothetical protein